MAWPRDPRRTPPHGDPLADKIGLLKLGIVRDSSLNSRNAYTVLAEDVTAAEVKDR